MFQARTIHYILFPAIIATCFLLSSQISRSISIPLLSIPKQKSAINYQSTLLKHSSLGNARFLSSLLWVQTLIESDIDHYRNNDLNSWMYLRFNTITDLDPKFYEAYLYGGQYLSVIKDDAKGAEVIFTKGIKVFPRDYQLNYYAAFNYYFELDNIKKALFHYERILGHPSAPPYLPSLIAKLKIKGGDQQMALQLIQTAYLNAKKGTPMKKHFLRSLYKINSQIDVECLNQENNSKCKKQDLFGRPYSKNEKGTYVIGPFQE